MKNRFRSAYGCLDFNRNGTQLHLDQTGISERQGALEGAKYEQL